MIPPTARPMLRWLLLACSLAATSPAFARSVLDGDPQKQAEAFIRIYSSFCLKHLTDLKTLTDRLAIAPRLPGDKAAALLQGHPGIAWTVPENSGTFVLAIRTDTPVCLVYGKKAGEQAVQKLFLAMMKAAPSPMFSRQVQDERMQTRHGPAQTVSYEWTMAGSPRKMIFSITTTESDTSPLQALATAQLIETTGSQTQVP